MYKDIIEASKRIAAVKDQVLLATSEEKENKLLQEYETIVASIANIDSNEDTFENEKIQQAWDRCYTETFLLKMHLRNKKERQIRNRVPNATQKDVSSIIEIDGGLSIFLQKQILMSQSATTFAIVEDAIKKDGAQRKSWLARNAVSEKEYMHYVRFIRDKMNESAVRVDSSSDSVQSARKNFSKFTKERSEQIMAIKYMDPTASKEEIDAIINMERGLLLFCEAQLTIGKMKVKEFIPEDYLKDVFKGKSREGSNNDMSCNFCNVM